MKKIIAAALFISALSTVAGCTHGAKLDTPRGFANLGDRGEFSYRAASELRRRRPENDPTKERNPA